MPTTVCELRGDAARQVLRGLRLSGAEVIARKRSPHGSDCSCSPDHLNGPMGQCRCIRVMRLRSPRAGDWILVFGDCVESQAMRLQGPFTPETPLSYGGGFWERVEV
jgi:hypothetical protein